MDDSVAPVVSSITTPGNVPNRNGDDALSLSDASVAACCFGGYDLAVDEHLAVIGCKVLFTYLPETSKLPPRSRWRVRS